MAVIQPQTGLTPGNFPGFPWIDVVRDWGAVGNGIADDTQAVQNAINAACRGRGWVYIPLGTYRITSTLEVTCHNMRIAGDGAIGVFAAAATEGVAYRSELVWDGVTGGK